MHIHLKRGEKIYVNGAVLRFDRRTSLEFLNDVDFLLENHVMQAAEANTPLRQLYFVVQSMLIDPANAGMTAELFKHLSHRAEVAAGEGAEAEAIAAAASKVSAGRYFEALRRLRAAFAGEAEVPTATTREKTHASHRAD